MQYFDHHFRQINVFKEVNNFSEPTSRNKTKLCTYQRGSHQDRDQTPGSTACMIKKWKGSNNVNFMVDVSILLMYD